MAKSKELSYIPCKDFRIEYGEDCISVYDNITNKEVLHWVKDEWVKDPNVVFSIVNGCVLASKGYLGSKGLL